VKQIASAAVQRALEVFRLGAVQALVATHQLAVHFGQLEAFAHARPDIVTIAQQMRVTLHQLHADLHRLAGVIGGVVGVSDGKGQ